MSEIQTYILKNQFLEVHILNYGGIIDAIYCADQTGKRENVVLSFAHKEDYIKIPGPYLNALVGPVAGRISQGRYQGRQLSCNDGTNHLHGGFHGISSSFFDMTLKSDQLLEARLTRRHDEDGYRGIFQYYITYRLEEDRLILNYDVTCSEPNLLYLTSHLYFNLSGQLKRSVCDEKLYASFQQMMYIDASGAPGEIVNIAKDSPFNFENGQLIADVLHSAHPQFQITRGIDHPFFVNGEIRLEDELSGRCLKIRSDQPCAVIYSSNYLDDTMLFQNDVKGYPGLGLAIELQDYANGIHFGLGEERQHYTQQTSYQFYTKKI